LLSDTPGFGTPGSSNVSLFCYGEGVIDLDSKISRRTLNLGVAKQQLDRPKIARSSVDQCCLCAS
jgi:hypothetical protein